jgi:ubiquinone/menaquinone biosynthesis C-methylase UbiE
LVHETLGAIIGVAVWVVIDDVRDSYDARAEEYAAFALGDLDRVTTDREWLAEFAELAALRDGIVADLGCGSGHVTNHLSQLGLTAIGYDIAPAMIATAERTFPNSNFEVGDITILEIADSSLAGIVARYSFIHLAATQLPQLFRAWSRMLQPEAPVLVSFFAASSADRHGSPFDHAIATAYELFPATIASELQDAGFDRIKVGLRGPLRGERPLDHGTILARQADD